MDFVFGELYHMVGELYHMVEGWVSLTLFFLSLIVSNILLRGYGHGKLKHMVDVDAMTR